MSGTGTADRTTEEEQGDLRRSLGFRDLVVYGLLFIAPMAPVGVYGTLGRDRGGVGGGTGGGRGVVGRGAAGAGGATKEAGTSRAVTAGDGALSYRTVTLAAWL
ncbi:hypothetical protein QFZ32_003325 [Streptomyces canus]|nr:hypothetical protein [Streptomyces canus]